MRTLREKAVQLLKEMVETPSVSGLETAVANLIKVHMDELGYGTHIDEVGNIIGEKGEGRPRILLCGHMDTVPGYLPVVYNDGVITGRGSVDAKGPLAALIIGGALAVESGFTGSLIVAGVVEEEGRNRGILQLIKHGFEVDYAVFGEPTNMNTITLGYKGSVLIKIDVKTQEGHSSAPWIYINAIEKAIELLWIIKDSASSLTEKKEGINALTTSIREITGGKGYGVNPSHCQQWIEFRVPSNITTNLLLETVRDRITDFRNANKGTMIEMEIIDSVEPYTADKKNNLVKAFSRSIYRQTGSRVTLVKKSGTGDMNYYGAETQAPCITYGPGDPHLDHTDQEHIKIQDYIKAIEIIKQTLLTLNT